MSVIERKWTQRELFTVRSYYGRKSIHRLAKKLRRGKESIYRKAAEIGVRTDEGSEISGDMQFSCCCECGNRECDCQFPRGGARPPVAPSEEQIAAMMGRLREKKIKRGEL